jgi:hypothetical protein
MGKKKDDSSSNKKRKAVEEEVVLPGLSKEEQTSLWQRYLWLKTQQDKEPIRVKVSVPCVEVSSKKNVSIEFYALWVSTTSDLQTFEIQFKFDNESHIVTHFKDWLKKIRKWSHDGYIKQYNTKTFDLWNTIMVEILPKLDEKTKIWSNLGLVIPVRFRDYLKRYKEYQKKLATSSPIQPQVPPPPTPLPRPPAQVGSSLMKSISGETPCLLKWTSDSGPTFVPEPLTKSPCQDTGQDAEFLSRKMDFVHHIVLASPRDWKLIEPLLSSIFHKMDDNDSKRQRSMSIVEEKLAPDARLEHSPISQEIKIPQSKSSSESGSSSTSSFLIVSSDQSSAQEAEIEETFCTTLPE